MVLIDLTYVIDEGGSKYPTDPAPRVVIMPAEVTTDGRVRSGYTELVLRSHHGTHVDAPAHKIPGGRTIDTYGVAAFTNTGVLVDLTQSFVDGESGYVRTITTAIVEEVFNQALVKRLVEEQISALLFRTGYDKVIERGVTQDINFPYLESQAAELLLHALDSAQVSLRVVGIDSFSFDPKGSWDSPAHRLFLSRDILLIETLVNLHLVADRFGRRSFELICLPIPYKNADAAQARVVVRARN
ncbi:MAG: cyclase family protein [candidate division KSB1 bacterium]|nr:cyclase family protein [candidate division KSB1 bacterium]